MTLALITRLIELLRDLAGHCMQEYYCVYSQIASLIRLHSNIIISIIYYIGIPGQVHGINFCLRPYLCVCPSPAI